MPDYHSVEAAIAWLDAAVHILDGEDVPLRTALARVLRKDFRASAPIPAGNRAARDGFAVTASASLGASSYNPIRLPLVAVAAGDALPAGTDAVVPLEWVEADGRAAVEVIEAVATGDNVEQQGAFAPGGEMLVRAGTPLAARHIGLLGSAGVSVVPVVRRPHARILVTKPEKTGVWEDSNGPMICAAVERDGGVVGECVAVEREGRAIIAALAEPGVDILLLIGGTGRGTNDHSAAAVAGTGELAIHGVALRPGETTGLGRTAGGLPIVLLPGAGAACLWSYELFGGRAIRRLGGRGAELPYRPREMTIARKIVSALGTTEIFPVRCSPDDTVEPLPSFAETGLIAAVGADGFVILPEGSEGCPQGARVSVYLYDNAGATGGFPP
jgi:molybdopterin molybdotransferase